MSYSLAAFFVATTAPAFSSSGVSHALIESRSPSIWSQVITSTKSPKDTAISDMPLSPTATPAFFIERSSSLMSIVIRIKAANHAMQGTGSAQARLRQPEVSPPIQSLILDRYAKGSALLPTPAKGRQ